MRNRFIHALLLLCIPFALHAADDEAAVRAADTRYWETFNSCDMKAMSELLSDDVEFYHDKTGLTATKTGLIDSLRKGPCADPTMHLRREAVAASVHFSPLAGGFALLTGTHRFYVRKEGTAEYLDGQAEFVAVWKITQGQWRMHRVVSYAHGPAH